MPLGKDQVTINNNITNVNICIIIKWRRAKCFNDQFLPIARANYRQSAIKSSNNDLSLSLSLFRSTINTSANARSPFRRAAIIGNGDNHTSETLRHNSRGGDGSKAALYAYSYNASRLPIGRIVPCSGYAVG